MDIFGLPQQGRRLDFKEATGGFTLVPVPKGAQFVFAYLVGPGGNGGDGASRAAGSAGGGGGSGASGGITNALIPANFFRGSLFVRVPGAGAGQPSVIALDGQGTYAVAVANHGGNGGTGTSAAVGVAGSTVGGPVQSRYGFTSFALGSNGASGGAIAGAAGIAATAVTLNTATLPGGSGAGSTSADFAGGSGILELNTPPGIAAVAGGAAGGGNGLPGGWVESHMAAWGASGGGSNNAGTGGRGGDGVGYGNGGGGGGAGVVGGSGGVGGPGRVILMFM